MLILRTYPGSNHMRTPFAAVQQYSFHARLTPPRKRRPPHDRANLACTQAWQESGAGHLFPVDPKKVRIYMGDRVPNLSLSHPVLTLPLKCLMSDETDSVERCLDKLYPYMCCNLFFRWSKLSQEESSALLL